MATGTTVANVRDVIPDLGGQVDLDEHVLLGMSNCLSAQPTDGLSPATELLGRRVYHLQYSSLDKSITNYSAARFWWYSAILPQSIYVLPKRRSC